MQKYDILLLDADDTLLDFDKAEDEAIKITFQNFNIPTDEETVSLYKKTNAECWKQLERGELDKISLRYVRFERFCIARGLEADAKAMAEFYPLQLSKQAFLIDGAKELCERLAKKCRLFIITNGIKSVQTERMKKTGISHLFEKCFISEDIGAEKPSEKFFDAVAFAIDGFDKSRTLVVGDSLTSDIAGGINFGVDTCWYNPRGAVGTGMTYTVKNYEELEAVIFG